MHFQYIYFILFFFFLKKLGTLGLKTIVSALNFDHYILTKCLKSKENIVLFMKKSLSLFKGIQVTTLALVAYFRYLHLFYVFIFGFEGMFWFAFVVEIFM